MCVRERELRKSPLAARAVAPEEIRPGMYVCVLHVIGEYVPYCECDVLLPATIEAVRYRRMPRRGERQPMKVIEVCLPFVLVRTARGRTHTVDVRQCRLARTSRSFGKAYFDAVKVDSTKQKDKEKSQHSAPERQ